MSRPHRGSAATIYDVAAEAGVSISTVSLALNTPGRVSERTREKVFAAVDTLGFTPKPAAVAKARRGVGRIGVIAPYTSSPSVARRVSGILAAAGRTPLEIVLFDQERAAGSASPLLASLPVTGRLDGLIVIGLPLDEAAADRLIGLRLPAVLVDVRHPGFDTVRTDDADGGRLAAGHLLERGHRRFGFLGEAQADVLAGYRSALADAGHDLADRDVRLVRARDAFTAAEELLNRPDRPTAVFAADDTLAAGVLRAAHRLGLAVPADVAVAGFGDGEPAEVIGLTTVRRPLEESGRAAVECLVQQLDRSTPPRDVSLGLELIPRGTT